MTPRSRWRFRPCARCANRQKTFVVTLNTRPPWRARWSNGRFVRRPPVATEIKTRTKRRLSMSKTLVSMTLNGRKVEEAVEPRTLLIHFLREKMNLTGAHIGCETSHCGACTVDIDGQSIKSCTHLAVQCEGSDVKTV